MCTGISSPDSESSKFILEGDERDLIGKLRTVVLKELAETAKGKCADGVEGGNRDDGRGWGRHSELFARDAG